MSQCPFNPTHNFLLCSLYDYIYSRGYLIVHYKRIEPNWEKLRLDYGEKYAVINRDYETFWLNGVEHASVETLTEHIDSILLTATQPPLIYTSLIYDPTFLEKYLNSDIDDINIKVRQDMFIERVAGYSDEIPFYEYKLWRAYRA